VIPREEFVKAVTSTVECKFLYGWTTTIIRLEHRYRYDEANGAGDGFFAKERSVQGP
jgi:hypothetical protein